MSHIVGTVMPSHAEEIPKSVKIFRSIISKFKRRIFNELDSSDVEGDKDTHNINKLEDAINYIINFGHILMSILKSKTNTSDDVVNLFNDNNVDILNLSYEERDLCKHYIHVDIYTYPYDLNNHYSKGNNNE